MKNSLLRTGDLIEIRAAGVIWAVDDDGLTWVLTAPDGTLAVVINPTIQEEFARIFVASVCETANCSHEFLRPIA